MERKGEISCQEQQDPGRAKERARDPAAAPKIRRGGGRRSSHMLLKCCESTALEVRRRILNSALNRVGSHCRETNTGWSLYNGSESEHELRSSEEKSAESAASQERICLIPSRKGLQNL